MLPFKAVDSVKIVLAVVIPTIIVGALLYTAYRWGQAGCKLDQAESQRDQVIDTRKAYENIDRRLPSDADLPGIADFLLRRAKGN